MYFLNLDARTLKPARQLHEENTIAALSTSGSMCANCMQIEMFQRYTKSTLLNYFIRTKITNVI